MHEAILNLQNTLSKMEVAINSISDAIVWTSSDGLVQWCNRGFEEILQRVKTEIIGKNILDIMHLSMNDSDLPEHLHPIRVVTRKGRLLKSVYDYIQNQTTLHLEISGNSVELMDEEQIIVFLIKDVTTLLKSQERMLRANMLLESRIKDRVTSLTHISNRFQSILEAAADAIISIDINGTILSINPAAEKMFGWMMFEVEGKNITMLMPEPHQTNHATYLARYLASGISKVVGRTRELSGKTKDGKLFPLQLSVSEVHHEDKLIFTGILRDMTKHKEALKSLHQAKLIAEKANNSKSDFLARISHEVRTPLNSIHGMADLIQESNLSEEQNNYVNLSKAAAEHLINIIEDLLDIDRIESGKIQLASTPFNLNQLLQDVTSIVRHTAKQKLLDVTCSITEDTPLNLIGDPKRVKQILINLMGNSVKFTTEGQVKTAVTCVNHGGDREVAELRFDISDTGIGIPPEKQKQIFESFSQADARITREYGGTGLGLAISKTLIQLMHGDISVKSTPGRGSCFTFTARFKTNPNTHDSPLLETVIDEDAILGNTDTESTKSHAPLRILLAEDVADNRMLIKAYLKRIDCHLDIAEDGEIAVEKFNTGNYDLILMDVQMPRMDGHSATRIIRRYEKEHGKTPVPIIALTAHAQQSDKKTSLAAGCDMHITKPVSKKLLLEAIHALTSQPANKLSGKADLSGQ